MSEIYSNEVIVTIDRVFLGVKNIPEIKKKFK